MITHQHIHKNKKTWQNKNGKACREKSWITNKQMKDSQANH